MGQVDVLVPLAIGIMVLAALVVWERETPEPMILLRLFASRIFAVASRAASCARGPAPGLRLLISRVKLAG